MNRRTFLSRSSQVSLGLICASSLASCRPKLLSEQAALTYADTQVHEDLFFKISLAQWSLRRSLWAGDIDPLDFAQLAKETFGIDGVEYVNTFFLDKAEDTPYLSSLKQRAEDHGVKSLVIMVDAEGSLAHKHEKVRNQSIENHYKWIHAAKYLGCHSIRVNTAGKGPSEQVANAAVDSLGKLAEYAAPEGINIIVENHGGWSSNGAWLAGVMQEVGMDNCGTLPDFGNFVMSLFPYKRYDTYRGIEELMPFAKGVSAKMHDFTAQGQELGTDYARALNIVKEAGYTGYIGIETEGYRLGEFASIHAAKHLLVQLGRPMG